MMVCREMGVSSASFRVHALVHERGSRFFRIGSEHYVAEYQSIAEGVASQDPRRYES